MILKSVAIEVDDDYFEYMARGKGEGDTRSEVVMLLPRPDDKILTLTKSFYPEHIFNLPSGGIRTGESYEQAFVREVAEETGLDIGIALTVGRIEHLLSCPSGELSFASYIIMGAQSAQTPCPFDLKEQITGYRDASVEDLRELAVKMRGLKGKWLGFGRFRATALDFAVDYLAKSLGFEQ